MKACNLILIFFTSLLTSNCYAAWERVIDIPAPAGLSRAEVPADSFAEYLRLLPLKADNKINVFNGSTLPGDSYNTLAVVGSPLLFTEDLEQCADFTMRFWADYLNATQQLDQLALFDFYGKPRPYTQSAKSFKQYLKWHMTYSNSYSIKHGAKKVHLLSNLQPGDMFVQNDSDEGEGIGHVSMVLDMAENAAGLKAYLVGYSFMPAQQFHIEKAEQQYGVDGWFTAQGYEQYARSQFSGFGEPVLMRYQRLDEL